MESCSSLLSAMSDEEGFFNSSSSSPYQSQYQSPLSIQERLEGVIRKPSNATCCDCNDKKPTWATIITLNNVKYGALCCYACSGAHRSLGTHISFVRSLSLDKWKEVEVQAMERGGNQAINAILEGKLLNQYEKPNPNVEASLRTNYIRDKYQYHRYIDQNAIQNLSSTMKEESTQGGIPTNPLNQEKPNRTSKFQRRNSMPTLSSTDNDIPVQQEPLPNLDFFEGSAFAAAFCTSSSSQEEHQLGVPLAMQISPDSETTTESTDGDFHQPVASSFGGSGGGRKLRRSSSMDMVSSTYGKPIKPVSRRRNYGQEPTNSTSSTMMMHYSMSNFESSSFDYTMDHPTGDGADFSSKGRQNDPYAPSSFNPSSSNAESSTWKNNNTVVPPPSFPSTKTTTTTTGMADKISNVRLNDQYSSYSAMHHSMSNFATGGLDDLTSTIMVSNLEGSRNQRSNNKDSFGGNNNGSKPLTRSKSAEEMLMEVLLNDKTGGQPSQNARFISAQPGNQSGNRRRMDRNLLGLGPAASTDSSQSRRQRNERNMSLSRSEHMTSNSTPSSRRQRSERNDSLSRSEHRPFELPLFRKPRNDRNMSLSRSEHQPFEPSSKSRRQRSERNLSLSRSEHGPGESSQSRRPRSDRNLSLSRSEHNVTESPHNRRPRSDRNLSLSRSEHQPMEASKNRRLRNANDRNFGLSSSEHQPSDFKPRRSARTQRRLDRARSMHALDYADDIEEDDDEDADDEEDDDIIDDVTVEEENRRRNSGRTRRSKSRERSRSRPRESSRRKLGRSNSAFVLDHENNRATADSPVLRPSSSKELSKGYASNQSEHRSRRSAHRSQRPKSQRSRSTDPVDGSDEDLDTQSKASLPSRNDQRSRRSGQRLRPKPQRSRSADPIYGSDEDLDMQSRASAPSRNDQRSRRSNHRSSRPKSQRSRSADPFDGSDEDLDTQSRTSAVSRDEQRSRRSGNRSRPKPRRSRSADPFQGSDEDLDVRSSRSARSSRKNRSKSPKQYTRDNSRRGDFEASKSGTRRRAGGKLLRSNSSDSLESSANDSRDSRSVESSKSKNSLVSPTRDRSRSRSRRPGGRRRRKNPTTGSGDEGTPRDEDSSSRSPKTVTDQSSSNRSKSHKRLSPRQRAATGRMFGSTRRSSPKPPSLDRSSSSRQLSSRSISSQEKSPKQLERSLSSRNVSSSRSQKGLSPKLTPKGVSEVRTGSSRSQRRSASVRNLSTQNPSNQRRHRSKSGERDEIVSPHSSTRSGKTSSSRSRQENFYGSETIIPLNDDVPGKSTSGRRPRPVRRRNSGERLNPAPQQPSQPKQNEPRERSKNNGTGLGALLGDNNPRAPLRRHNSAESFLSQSTPNLTVAQNPTSINPMSLFLNTLLSPGPKQSKPGVASQMPDTGMTNLENRDDTQSKVTNIIAHKPDLPENKSRLVPANQLEDVKMTGSLPCSRVHEGKNESEEDGEDDICSTQGDDDNDDNESLESDMDSLAGSENGDEGMENATAMKVS